MEQEMSTSRDEVNPRRSGRRRLDVTAKTCPICGRVFSKAEHMLRHERSHSQTRPYRCLSCSKNFTRKDTLMRHERGHIIDDVRVGSVVPSPAEEDSSPSTVTQGVCVAGPQLGSIPSSSNETRNNHVTFDEGLTSASGSASLNTAQIFSVHENNNQSSVESISTHADDVRMGDNEDLIDPLIGVNDANMWMSPNCLETPLWVLGEDFNFDDWSSSLFGQLDVTDVWTSPIVGDQHLASLVTTSAERDTLNEAHPDIRTPWFTDVVVPTDEILITESNTRSHSVERTLEERSSSAHLPERFMSDITQQMTPNWKEAPVPSYTFLNLCSQLYFTKFHDVFPVLHRPSFCATPSNALLLISIASVGSLFVGSSSARKQGSKIFEQLNKVILHTWEKRLARHPKHLIVITQAAMIGQTFAMLSGPTHLAILQTFHGTVIAWARRSGILKASKYKFDGQTISHLLSLGNSDLEAIWLDWSRSEQSRRTALALYIQDAEISSLFHHEPALRHPNSTLHVSQTAERFQATNAKAWLQVLQSRSYTDPQTYNDFFSTLFEKDYNVNGNSSDTYTLYVILQAFNARCSAKRCFEFTSVEQVNFFQALINWHTLYQATISNGQFDNLCLMSLWHSIFVKALVDLERLERIVGRDGAPDASDLAYVREWATSERARRAIIHVSMLRKSLESLPFNKEPGIHVPRVLFQAGIVWACFVRHASGNTTLNGLKWQTFIELKALNRDPLQQLFEEYGFRRDIGDSVESLVLCGLTDMLQRLGHWELARKLATILGSLIPSGVEEAA